jgi:hypothetical protein
MVDVYVSRNVTYNRRIEVAVPMSVPEDSVEDYVNEHSHEFWDAADDSNYDDLDQRDAEVESVDVLGEADEDAVACADFVLETEWED